MVCSLHHGGMHVSANGLAGKCFAIVPREVAPKGFIDVDEKGYEKFWKEYNDILISEDVRPPPSF